MPKETRGEISDPEPGDFDEELARADPRDVEVVEASSGRRVIQRTRGSTASGVPITDELIKKLAEEAEAGYDVDEALRRRSASS